MYQDAFRKQLHVTNSNIKGPVEFSSIVHLKEMAWKRKWTLKLEKNKKKKTTLKPSQAQPRFQSKSEQVSKTTGRSTSQNDSQFSRKFTSVFVSTSEMRPRDVIFSGNVSLLLCPFVMLIIFCMIVKNTYRCPIIMLITILVVAQYNIEKRSDFSRILILKEEFTFVFFLSS